LLFAQAVPFAIWFTHAPPVQYLPAAQVTTLLAVQAPAPLHTDAVFIARSVLHDAATHTVSPAG
jgi:hypothetical protein